MLRVACCCCFLLMYLTTTPSYACGPDSACVVDSRNYRIHLPDNDAIDQPHGAILFAHGYRGSAKGVMRNSSLRALADELGVALIALDARGNDWHIDGVPSHSVIHGTDDFAYVDAVVRDATTRFDIDANEIMVSGFSAGGMMVWNLACHMGDRFAGFAPVSGTFWRPVPVDCPAPAASLVHIHGNADNIVPMQGRPIGDAYQGDVNKAVAMYTKHGEFKSVDGYSFGELECKSGQNEQGRILDLCTFEGGHSFKTGFVRFAWNRLMTGE